MELPVEVITNIMRFLDDQSDLFPASLVSKAWYTASRDPCLQSEVNVTITITPSRRILTDVLHLNQSRVIELKVQIAPETSTYGKKGYVQPSDRTPCHCNNNARDSTQVRSKATLFGIEFDTLVLPYSRRSPGNSFDICRYLIETSRNLRSLKLLNRLVPIFACNDQARLHSALQNITDIRIHSLRGESSAPDIDVGGMPHLKTITLESFNACTMHSLEALWNFCDASAGSLEMRLHGAHITFDQVSEDLHRFLDGQRIRVCILYVEGESRLTRDKLAYLGDITRAVQRLDLNVGTHPELEMLKALDSGMRSIPHVNLRLACDASNTLGILSVLSNVSVVFFDGPRFSLKLLGPRGEAPLGIHLMMKTNQDILEPTEEILSSIRRSGPRLCSTIEMLVYNTDVDTSYEVVKEALSTFEGVTHLFASATHAFRIPETSKFSKLRSLRIPGYQHVDAVLCSPMPRLQILSVAETPLTDQGLRSMSKYASNLTDLDVSSCIRITDEGLVTVLNNCKELRNLRLCECTSLTNKCVEYIAEHSNLRSLRVDKHDSYYDKAKEILGELVI